MRQDRKEQESMTLSCSTLERLGRLLLESNAQTLAA
jgi:hypothetical protein